MTRRHFGVRLRSARVTAGLRLRRKSLAFRRPDGAARVRGGSDSAARSPRLEIVDRIDDATTEFAIGWPGAVGPMLFKRSGREAEKFRRFFGAQETRRQGGEIRGHGSNFRGIRGGRRRLAVGEDHDGEVRLTSCRAILRGFKIPHQKPRLGRLALSAMTKQRAIAARDHGAGLLEQRFDCVASRGCLPVVAAEAANTEHDLRYFLLGRAVAMTVEALQHPSLPRSLLTGQPSIRWDDAPVERGKQATNRLEPVESLQAERHKRCNTRSN